MDDPISRLEVVTREIDRVFGGGHAAAHPELVIAVMNARRATGRQRVSLWPSSEWPRRCWSRRRRSTSCPPASCCGRGRDRRDELATPSPRR
jgi:hypothetical protein